jgi:F-type H+-transporting ATPase subunit epsilon
MRLTVLLPTEVLLEEAVTKIVAEAPNGHFCLLPRHVDFVSVLVPGVLAYAGEDGGRHYVATDEAVLVKCGGDVTVSAHDAVRSDDLGALDAMLDARFRNLDEEQQTARAVLAELEAGVLKRFWELEKRAREQSPR